MGLTRDSAAEQARADLAKRLMLELEDIAVISVTDKDFPDMSLGAPVDDEMAAQMISSGWQIELAADDESFEYRADKYQLRLHNFEGRNYVIVQ